MEVRHLPERFKFVVLVGHIHSCFVVAVFVLLMTKPYCVGSVIKQQNVVNVPALTLTNRPQPETPNPC